MHKSNEILSDRLNNLMEEYNKIKALNLSLDLSRGKPGQDQINLSNGLFDVLQSDSDFFTPEGIDCRNYGVLDGIPSIRGFFAEMLGLDADNVFVGGNSSLNMMFDTITHFVTHGINGQKPWFGQGVKFLCPVPGYDRHFAITEYYGIEMINIPLNDDGPDMDMVEKLVQEDELIKGIWCVPKYSNPSGSTYSDETVRRFANLKPKANDFKIIWDNAYCIHDLVDDGDELLNIMEECKKAGTEDLPIIFCSTSKITFPGSGVAAMAASKRNMQDLKRRYSYQTIGADKVNQLRHMRFFKDLDNVKRHMRKHRDIIKPKFDIVLATLKKNFGDNENVNWSSPNGGYFITLVLPDNCAKRTVELCKQAGLILTPAGAPYPYGKDPHDAVLRIAPTFSPLEDIQQAADLLCLCAEIAITESEIK